MFCIIISFVITDSECSEGYISFTMIIIFFLYIYYTLFGVEEKVGIFEQRDFFLFIGVLLL